MIIGMIISYYIICCTDKQENQFEALFHFFFFLSVFFLLTFPKNEVKVYISIICLSEKCRRSSGNQLESGWRSENQCF
jgi:hypothetical protein